MKRLLDIEFHKFRHSKSSLVITIIYLVIVAVLPLLGLIKIGPPDTKSSLADLGIFNFPFIWHLSTFLISWLKVLIAIVIVSLTANEYSNRTLKQNLIDGLSKKELILSKFYFVTALALATTLVVFVEALILGLFNSDFNEWGIIVTDLQYIGAFFVAHLVFFCFCLFAGILVKRGAFALGVISVWLFAEWLIRGICGLIDWRFDYDAWPIMEQILPIHATYYLIEEPFTKFNTIKSGIELLTQEGFNKDYSVPMINIAVCLTWSAIFIYWSYRLLKRRDL